MANTAWPFTTRWFHQMGIDEDALVREASASHRLAMRWLGGGGSGSHGVMTYGQGASSQLRNAFNAHGMVWRWAQARARWA
jgi:hypothetical protein